MADYDFNRDYRYNAYMKEVLYRRKVAISEGKDPRICDIEFELKNSMSYDDNGRGFMNPVTMALMLNCDDIYEFIDAINKYGNYNRKIYSNSWIYIQEWIDILSLPFFDSIEAKEVVRVLKETS